MIVLLPLLLKNDTWTLQQESLDTSTNQRTHRIKHHLIVLSKSRRVEIHHSGGIAKRFLSLIDDKRNISGAMKQAPGPPGSNETCANRCLFLAKGYQNRVQEIVWDCTPGNWLRTVVKTRHQVEIESNKSSIQKIHDTSWYFFNNLTQQCKIHRVHVISYAQRRRRLVKIASLLEANCMFKLPRLDWPWWSYPGCGCPVQHRFSTSRSSSAWWSLLSQSSLRRFHH